MKPKEWKNKNFWEALKCSLHGMKCAFQTERNLKIQFVFAIIAITMGIILKCTIIEWGILIITIGMVLFAEFVNTAIEKVLDVYSEKYDEKIKVAKDIASSAVLLTSIISIIIGGILFLPKIIK